eukprot:CAMPEP_0197825160 /NCGR_PEP_ID=MMETSP1437-20131217/2292_1 /TAXON_ID=49252 ORGANISM="Eucampia antarctica, Strain CCMP1452" /NCGR_SAMPLE_ID=MMETSP1437 /ASSEMBLY_ACC=CAM_ASM_001096 /LENGTH=266 /DNA_ID=CAMNT_0043425047 /DNA_START=196 /DNA_END=993 /DNA_ORIENTATION=+
MLKSKEEVRPSFDLEANENTDNTDTRLKSKEEIRAMTESIKVQGGTLRTCSFDQSVDRVQVLLKTSGRPLNSKVVLWQGPDNAPQKIIVYLEEGNRHQFRAVIETPGASSAFAIYNTGSMEFPFDACLDPEVETTDGKTSDSPSLKMTQTSESRLVQGGSVYSTPFPPSVQSVEIMLNSDGRPMNARIELLQGPNNIKQFMEVYIEDGTERPFYVILDTPGNGNVVRIVNTSPIEYPMSTIMKPYDVDTNIVETDKGIPKQPKMKW